MVDRLDTAFWLALAFFGFASLATAVSHVGAGTATLATFGQLLGAGLVAGAAAVALVGGDAVAVERDDVDPRVRAVAIAGAVVYVAVTVVELLPVDVAELLP